MLTGNQGQILLFEWNYIALLQGWLKEGVFLKPPPLESKNLENPYS